MKLTDHLHVLPITVNVGGEQVLNHSLILDDTHGPTLVDAGGSLEAIQAALEGAGLKLRDLRRLILTHQDLDHVAGAAAVKRESGAQVLAHIADVPYIEGTHRLLKLPPLEALDRFPPEVRAFLERGPEPVSVDHILHGDELLGIAGGVRVLHTPGHTPGHVSLYLERDRALIAGDAVVVQDGQVQPPSIRATPDMTEAKRSVARLAALEIEVLVAYHGGVAQGNIVDQLCAISQT